jgi:thioredoxin reductase (NADPH)
MAESTYDVVIIGSGPAGLQAAIHAARRRRTVLVLGRPQNSNLVKAHVENLFGIENVTGEGLLAAGRAQAARAGSVLVDEDATGIARDVQTGLFTVTLESRTHVSCTAVVLATGISLERLNVPGEKEFLGRGVSYCVDCDAAFYKGKRVAVVGGGSAAVEGALTLLSYAANVHLVCDELNVQADLRRELDASNVIVHLSTKVKAIAGTSKVSALDMEPGGALELDGVFIELGAKGVLELTLDIGVELDPESFKYILTDRQQQTNVEGVFAAGDITGQPWQAAKAIGEGCVAGLSAATYVRNRTHTSP